MTAAIDCLQTLDQRLQTVDSDLHGMAKYRREEFKAEIESDPELKKLFDDLRRYEEKIDRHAWLKMAGLIAGPTGGALVSLSAIEFLESSKIVLGLLTGIPMLGLGLYTLYSGIKDHGSYKAMEKEVGGKQNYELLRTLYHKIYV